MKKKKKKEGKIVNVIQNEILSFKVLFVLNNIYVFIDQTTNYTEDNY